MPQKCHVIKCTAPVIAQGLCSMHYKRNQRHNSVDAGRPTDWGQREKHPAYRTWCGLIRYHKNNTDPAWVKDFWSFVADIPERPKSAKAFRSNPKIPWGKDNFYWKEQRSCSADRKEYAREWQRQSRAANPDYYKNRYIKKHYGVDLSWFNDKFAQQGGVCAICKQPETAVIRGVAISLSADHCHTTGQARGLLCRACNNALGMLHHDRAILTAAISYLEQSQ